MGYSEAKEVQDWSSQYLSRHARTLSWRMHNGRSSKYMHSEVSDNR